MSPAAEESARSSPGATEQASETSPSSEEDQPREQERREAADEDTAVEEIGRWEALVTGVVKNESGDALAGICVDLLADDEGHAELIESATKTDGSGRYSVREPRAIPDWRLRFRDCRPRGNLAYEWAGDTADASAARRFGPGRHEANAVLGPGATISGTITGDDGRPAEGVCIHAHDGTRLRMGEEEPWYRYAPYPAVRSQADGGYQVRGLAPGSYRIRFFTGSVHDDDCSNMAFQAEWYDDRNVGDHGDWSVAEQLPDTEEVALEPGQDRDGIDAVLQRCTDDHPC